MSRTGKLSTCACPTDGDRPSACATCGARWPHGWAPALLAALAIGCTEPGQEVGRRAGALVQATGPIRIAAEPDLALEAGEVLVRGAWGSGAGQFGRDDEASRPGPMSLAVGAGGELVVLDQVNRRLFGFDRTGRLQRELALPSQACEDVVAVGEELWVLLYEPGAEPGYRLHRYGKSGGLRLDLRLDRSLDLVTGLFADGSAATPDLWIEQRHEEQVQVVARGEALSPLAVRPRLRGRPDPSQPGSRLLASRVGRQRALVERIFPGNYTSPVVEIETPLPLIAIDDLAADAEGGLYVALLIGEEGDGPEYAWRELRHILLVLRGAEVRTIALATTRAADAFRTLAVGRDGAVHQLETTEEGVIVRRWSAGTIARGGRR